MAATGQPLTQDMCSWTLSTNASSVPLMLNITVDATSLSLPPNTVLNITTTMRDVAASTQSTQLASSTGVGVYATRTVFGTLFVVSIARSAGAGPFTPTANVSLVVSRAPDVTALTPSVRRLPSAPWVVTLTGNDLDLVDTSTVALVDSSTGAAVAPTSVSASTASGTTVLLLSLTGAVSQGTYYPRFSSTLASSAPSATQLAVWTPTHTTGTAAVSSVSPTSGSNAGGFSVTVSGSILGSGSDITAVRLANTLLTTITTQSTSQVVVSVPVFAPSEMPGRSEGAVTVYAAIGDSTGSLFEWAVEDRTALILGLSIPAAIIIVGLAVLAGICLVRWREGVLNKRLADELEEQRRRAGSLTPAVTPGAVQPSDLGALRGERVAFPSGSMASGTTASATGSSSSIGAAAALALAATVPASLGAAHGAARSRALLLGVEEYSAKVFVGHVRPDITALLQRARALPGMMARESINPTRTYVTGVCSWLTGADRTEASSGASALTNTNTTTGGSLATAPGARAGLPTSYFVYVTGLAVHDSEGVSYVLLGLDEPDPFSRLWSLPTLLAEVSGRSPLDRTLVVLDLCFEHSVAPRGYLPGLGTVPSAPNTVVVTSMPRGRSMPAPSATAARSAFSATVERAMLRSGVPLASMVAEVSDSVKASAGSSPLCTAEMTQVRYADVFFSASAVPSSTPAAPLAAVRRPASPVQVSAPPSSALPGSPSAVSLGMGPPSGALPALPSELYGSGPAPPRSPQYAFHVLPPPATVLPGAVPTRSSEFAVPPAVPRHVGTTPPSPIVATAAPQSQPPAPRVGAAHSGDQQTYTPSSRSRAASEDTPSLGNEFAAMGASRGDAVSDGSSAVGPGSASLSDVDGRPGSDGVRPPLARTRALLMVCAQSAAVPIKLSRADRLIRELRKGGLALAPKIADRLRKIRNIEDPSGVRQKNMIGSGAFGAVYKGTLWGSPVAIKVLHNLTEKHMVELIYETELLSMLRHPNVTLFMGLSSVDQKLAMILEFVDRGSLFGLLQDPGVQLPAQRVVRLALGVARGIEYLHSQTPPIIHRDLKSLNVLVDSSWNAKVADFGLSKVREASMVSTSVGSPPWMAPEVLRPGARYDERCDAYSYGFVLWELATRKIPFQGMDPLQIISQKMMGSLSIDMTAVPPEFPSVLRVLMERCTSNDPTDRPRFSEIVQEIELLDQSYREDDDSDAADLGHGTNTASLTGSADLQAPSANSPALASAQ